METTAAPAAKSALSNGVTYGDVYAENGGPTNVVGTWDFGGTQISTGTYKLVSGSFASASPVTQLNFWFVAPLVSSCDTTLNRPCWQGWVYIDDLQIG
jgi:hypothetical protein